MRPTANFNFDNLEFEKWLSNSGLIKGVTTYSEDLSYARRAYLAVVEKFTYGLPTSYTASDLIKELPLKADNLGLNIVLVTILRANRIPARLIHRKNPPRPTKSNREVVEEEGPVIETQFYVDHIGWLTANPTDYLKGRNPQFNPARPETLIGGFAVDTSKSVVTGADGLNFVDMPVVGHRLISLDGPTLMFDHKILTNNWLVTEVPNKPTQ